MQLSTTRPWIARIALASSLLAAGVAMAAPKAAASTVAHGPRVALPAPQTTNAGWASSNWSGYAKSGTYTAITGKWTVPSVSSSSGATYSSSWIGIDGFTNSNLIQTGTEQDYYNGRAHYAAWWEILPASATFITSLTIHPGDHMSASIKKGSGSNWTISISDTTTGHSFSTTKTYNGPHSSAEWIEEAPTVGGRQAKLAHYSTFTFDPGTVNGTNPNLSSSNRGVMIQSGHQVSTPSNPDSDTDGFRTAYGATAPSPPSS